MPSGSRAPTVSEHAVLGLLGFGEQSGYELHRLAAQSIGYIWAPAKSQIYKVLPRLAALGLAEARLVAQSKRPDKQLHRLTAAGERTLQEWLARVDPEDDPDVRLLKIFFGGLGPRVVLADQVAAYRTSMAERLARYEELDRRLPRDDENELPLEVLALGLLRTRAALGWAEALLERVSPGAAAPSDPGRGRAAPRA